MSAKYISCAETAKLIRATLKQTFPATKFSVRSKTYSGGASITVEWVDGPAACEVKHAIGKYEGATFDGMQDLKSYHTSELNGETVHFGADFIFCERRYSVAFLERRARTIAEYWGQPMPRIYDNGFGAHAERDYSWTSNGRDTLADLVLRQAGRTSVK